ncbi:uncharacterized protein AB675_6413 [Cyphellophora attinorum]|uniref:DUF7918 domain-containing protein n=1 Tax=Cyphellophora attinorum TaxID=1664694 RepID=A0A0N0NQQ8_9EURO|nr:uncharacterized protein AB675_6413 [Phialophora attinorum]KPI44201.1 hypothetical protein AB675_6413 [Phialophora attinorum]
MVRHGLFDVTVNSPGLGALQEYDDPNPGLSLKDVKGPAVVKHIEAVAGAEFSVSVKVEAGFVYEECDAVSFRLEADGERVRSKFMLQNKWGSRGYSREMLGRRIVREDSSQAIQKLHFASLSLVELSDAGLSDQTSAGLGSLRLTVDRRRMGLLKKTPATMTTPAAMDGIESVSETTIKGRHVDLKTTFGAVLPPKNFDRWSAAVVGNESLLTVVLKYRTKKGLQHEGIIEQVRSTDISDDVAGSGSGDKTMQGRAVQQAEPEQAQQARNTGMPGDVATSGSSCSNNIVAGSGVERGVKQEEPEQIQTVPSTGNLGDVAGPGSGPGSGSGSGAIITNRAGVEHGVKQEGSEQLERKRKRSPADNGTGNSSDDTKDRGYLTELVKKIRIDLEALNTDKNATPGKFENQKAALLRKVATLQDEVIGNVLNEEGTNGTPIKKETAGQNISDAMEISDDDE